MGQVERFLEEKYGAAGRLSGGYTNLAYKIKTNPPLVAKIASLSNEDLLNEANALQVLHGKVPTPKYIDDHSLESSFILVTSYERGENGQSILDTGDMAKAEAVFKNMGLVLANLIHSHAYTDGSLKLRKAKVLEPASLDFVPQPLVEKSRTFFPLLSTDMNEWVLSHGDYGSHNILFDSDGKITVIDWEWTEWFHPLVDIAWTLWNTKLHYPHMADRLNQAFLKAYQSVRPLAYTEPLIKAYVLYKIWHLLNRLHHADAAVQNNWVSRLDWTLRTNIL
jgi:aminoglycoside phosphotransferase